MLNDRQDLVEFPRVKNIQDVQGKEYKEKENHSMKNHRFYKIQF